MSTNGILDFQNTNKVIFRGTDSNVVVDTSNASIGIGIQGTEKPGSNLHVIGDASISSNLKLTTDTSITVNSNVVTDFNGPHAREPKEVPLKKYPESHITFNWNTMEKFHNTTTGVGSYYIPGGGYKVSASSVYSQSSSSEGGAYGLYAPWKVFDRKGWQDPSIERYGWLSDSGKYSSSDGSVGSADTTTYNGSSTATGEWLELKLPKKIKLKYFSIVSMTHNSSDVQDRMPKTATLLGSNDGSTWSLINDVSLGIPTEGVWINVDVNATEYYKYIRFVVTSTHADGTPAFTDTGFTELEYYGYEEDPPAGDISVDTTFKSVLNTPQITGANVYVDAKLSSDFTNQVTGPTPVGSTATHDNTNKYWEMNGQLTSNITVEANTFLEGDQPHAVSVWFNSSNLEANVSNTCVFSIASEEKLDSQNLDLQSNTWHNLTYSYQGEGGSRVTYLDGRKVSEDQAEDTFGDYPPFAMTGYSQGGYVVSASDTFQTYYPYLAFNKIVNTTSDYWFAGDDTGGVGIDGYTGSVGGDHSYIGGDNLGGYTGIWIKLEMPHKLSLSYIEFYQVNGSMNYTPRDFYVIGSNDDITWDLIHRETSTAADSTFTSGRPITTNSVNNHNKYKYIAIVVDRTVNDNRLGIGEIKLYGHRENDLVRLPDPTNVLKYPHIAMTGPAQRGYVASASSVLYDGTNTQYQTWKAFDNTLSGNHGWVSHQVYNQNGPGEAQSGLGATEFPAASGRYGEYLDLQLPHGIKVKNFVIKTRPNTGSATWIPEDSPGAGYLYGSINGTDWTEIKAFSGLTYGGMGTDGGTQETVQVDSTTAYKYLRLQVTHRAGQNSTDQYLAIGELEYYGTGVDSIPIQIGGGNIDKVANFRVYDKFIDENQALEIWDAQKDEFGSAKSSMTLHKGRLGIGTTEPEGRLAVADEPNGLEEFPPRAMTDYKTYFEGHGEFCVSSGDPDPSDTWSSTTGLGSLFDKGKTQADTRYYRTSSGTFDSGTGYYTGSNSIGGISGAWVRIDFPYRAKIQSMNILTRSDTFNGRAPRDGYLLGKNSDEDAWTIVHEWTEAFYYKFIERKFTIEASKYYSSYALVATRLLSAAETDTNSTSVDRLNMSEWRLFGIREQGQSVLHDGQLTLTKNLDVPRIGPPLDADDTPRRDRLVVEYNTSSNPTFEGAVRDTSGRRNDGVFYGGATYDANEKALMFDGSDDIIETDLGSRIFKNSSLHTTSLWVKMNRHTSSEFQQFFSLGNGLGNPNGNLNHIQLFHSDNYGLRLSFTQHDYRLGEVVPIGQWVHVAYTYDGTTWQNTTTPTNVNIYINGTKVGITSVYQITGGGGSALNLSIAKLGLGASTDFAQTSPSNSQLFTHCDISNFKLYDTVLTAEEVKTLYDMGRCDEGHHVVNFSKTRVGIGLGDGEAPRGALDVRGNAFFNGLLSTGLPAIFGRVNNQNLVQQSTVDQNITDVLYTQGQNMKRTGGGLLFPVAGMYIIQLRTHCWYSGGAYAVRDEHQYTRYNSAGTVYSKQDRGTIYDVAMGASGGNSDMHHASIVFIYANEGDYLILSHTTSPTTTRNYNNEWNFISAACLPH